MTKKSEDQLKSDLQNISIGSVIFANKPGDGSAREQAASCQRVLGGALGNIAKDYATKRYRSNVINWGGMLPFTINTDDFEIEDTIVVKDLRSAVESGVTELNAKLYRNEIVSDITLKLENLSNSERKIILDGCLMNFYANETHE